MTREESEKYLPEILKELGVAWSQKEIEYEHEDFKQAVVLAGLSPYSLLKLYELLEEKGFVSSKDDVPMRDYIEEKLTNKLISHFKILFIWEDFSDEDLDS